MTITWPPVSTSLDLDPDRARLGHQHAVQSFIDLARAVPAERWDRSTSDTVWSPAQIAEHLRRTYEVVGAQLTGRGSGIRVRTSWWLRLVLRWRYMGDILARGAIPRGARAPREIRPGAGPFDRDNTLAELQLAADAAERALVERWDDAACVMTHHVFGNLRPPEAMRFAAVHATHHAKQITARTSSAIDAA